MGTPGDPALSRATLSRATPLPPAADREPAGLSDYCALARPSHWVKHVFIVPGVVLAGLLMELEIGARWLALVIGFASASLVTSANYVLNEWLDAPSDAFHPIKHRRPAVAKRLDARLVLVEYVALVLIGLGLAWQVSRLFFATSVVLLLAGVVYNVPPARTKDVAYLDVLTEAINNPLRLVLGWAMVDGSTLPPSSVLVADWMGGAFLMAVKRLGEYRAVVARVGEQALAAYRRSFASYTSISLLISAFIYALMSGFFLAVFLIKYRIEYLLALPALAGLFGWYLAVGLRVDSRVQAPETLLRERGLMAMTALLVGLLVLLTWVDIPWLGRLYEPFYISLPWD
jgi:4-hydroxybenzoate polyprenyltransferase